MKTKLKLFFAAALAAFLIASPTANATTAGMTPGTNANPDAAMTALFGDPVIAKGNGFSIKQSELDQVVTGISSAAAAHNQTISSEQMTGIKAQMLNRLIQIQLLLQKATPADRAEGQKKADEQIALLQKRAGSTENFIHQLQAVGMTPEELRAKVSQEATATSTLTRELGVTVTGAEVTNFYNTHSADFEEPEMAHVRHLLLLTIDPVTHAPLSADEVAAKHKQITDLLKRIKAGEDFATLAKQYSEDSSSKENGGELPEFPRDAQGIPPELSAAAFSLNTNQISDVVTMGMGYDIVQLLDKTSAKKLALIDKVPMTDLTVAAKIKDFLLQQKTEKLAPPYLAKLKKTAEVQIVDANLKAASDAAEAAAMSAATNADSDSDTND
ncbi:MAG TPA: peptidylprolyl isomerase [Verrucomicrobiae bacterium]|nr:peptidylprolyl isomerase [Verrucomicrobiae bacterium]